MATGTLGSSCLLGTFFRFWPRKCSSALLCTDVSSAWNQLQMRCACSHVEWCSKNLYSASWYFTHSLLPAGRDQFHTEADTPATVPCQGTQVPACWAALVSPLSCNGAAAGCLVSPPSHNPAQDPSSS